MICRFSNFSQIKNVSKIFNRVISEFYDNFWNKKKLLLLSSNFGFFGIVLASFSGIDIFLCSSYTNSILYYSTRTTTSEDMVQTVCKHKAEHCEKYGLCQKLFQIKFVEDSVSYKKVSGCICLSLLPPPSEGAWGSENCRFRNLQM